MVVIEQCRIDTESNKLLIAASIENLEYFKNYYIKDVIIQTQDTFKSTGPDESEDIVITEGIQVNSKSITLYLDEKAIKEGISLSKDIIFVYVRAEEIVPEGEKAAEVPLDLFKNNYSIAVAVDFKTIYEKTMYYIKELKNKCYVSSGFIDMILLLKAFELALSTGEYNTAIRLWEYLSTNINNIFNSPKCSCYGTH